MYIVKKIALKKTRIHSDDTCTFDESQIWKDIKAYCNKGDIYYQICNGTIGRGHRYKNYSEKSFLKILNSEARTWISSKGFKTEKQLKKERENMNELTNYNTIIERFIIKKNKTIEFLNNYDADVIENILEVSGLNTYHVKYFKEKEKEILNRLNTLFWREVFSLTDLEKYMSASTQDKWRECLYYDKNFEMPEFNEDNIYNTLKSLYDGREENFNKKVIEVYTSLNYKYKTNDINGFSDKLIINNYHDDRGFTNYNKKQVLNDLRDVINRLSNRKHSDRIETFVYEFGEWQNMDNDLWAIKFFKNGNAHIKILNEVLVNQLNLILSGKYKNIIGDKPLCKSDRKKFLSSEILNELYNHTQNLYSTNYSDEVKKILKELGIEKIDRYNVNLIYKILNQGYIS